MEAEIEERFAQLQLCIEEGHSYEINRESFNGEFVDLECTVCDHIKSVELTKEQGESFDKLYEDEDSLLETILKNKPTGHVG